MLGFELPQRRTRVAVVPVADSDSECRNGGSLGMPVKAAMMIWVRAVRCHRQPSGRNNHRALIAPGCQHPRARQPCETTRTTPPLISHHPTPRHPTKNFSPRHAGSGGGNECEVEVSVCRLQPDCARYFGSRNSDCPRSRRKGFGGRHPNGQVPGTRQAAQEADESRCDYSSELTE